MKKEEQPSLGYDFEFIGFENNSYIFETDSKITYEIQFKPTPYLFDKKYEFANLTFEFVISVVYNSTHGRPPLDV